jgi:thioredoxin-related protein
VKWLRWSALAALVLFVLPALAGNSAAQTAAATTGHIIGAQVSEHPPWFKRSFLEIADDVAEADAASKHVMLYFELDGCPYCYKMIEENFKHSPYIEFLQEKFDVIAINIKGDRDIAFNAGVSLSEKELAQHLNIYATPTIIFLDRDTNPVLRLNGYRSVAGFKYALDYVAEKAYRHISLPHYIEQQMTQTGSVYTLRDHPNFAVIRDLKHIPDKPLAVLFEDKYCDECATLHDDILNRADTKAILDKFTVVRLDAYSDEPIVDPNGNRTTPRAFAEKLGIDYRPGIVLFDGGEEKMRIDGMLRTYHFQGVLSYVGERQYRQYPRFRDYMQEREQRILGSGRDIDIME